VEGGALFPALDDELGPLLRADLVEGGAGDLGPGLRLADVGPVGGLGDGPRGLARRGRGGGAGAAQQGRFAQQVLVVADEERAADLQDLGADGRLQADLGTDAEGIAGGDREDRFQGGAPRRG
jgi:hypothetical protein